MVHVFTNIRANSHDHLQLASLYQQSLSCHFPKYIRISPKSGNGIFQFHVWVSFDQLSILRRSEKSNGKGWFIRGSYLSFCLCTHVIKKGQQVEWGLKCFPELMFDFSEELGSVDESKSDRAWVRTQPWRLEISCEAAKTSQDAFLWGAVLLFISKMWYHLAFDVISPRFKVISPRLKMISSSFKVISSWL